MPNNVTRIFCILVSNWIQIWAIKWNTQYTSDISFVLFAAHELKFMRKLAHSVANIIFCCTIFGRRHNVVNFLSLWGRIMIYIITIHWIRLIWSPQRTFTNFFTEPKHPICIDCESNQYWCAVPGNWSWIVRVWLP